MHGVDFLHEEQWSLEIITGYAHPILTLNKETLLYTWAILAFLLCFCLLFRSFLIKNSYIRFIALSYTQFFIQMIEQSLPTFMSSHFYFIAALFTFIVLCNIASMVPFLDEPTKDLNTTLALGLISFVYTQCVAIKASGPREYIKGYFKPFFIMLPLNLLGKLASIMSLSIRLFG